jgi:murein DD-endopeptidase MepM/ murein hydrolase activator NlpD
MPAKRGAFAFLVCAAIVVGSAGAVRAADAPTTTTTTGTTGTTATTAAPSPSTVPTTTTVPTISTVPANPNGERSALPPEETLAAQAEFATLTDAQRALLGQLQAARDALATRRFGLVALARQVTAARDQLDKARETEHQAQARVEETLAQVRGVKQEIADLTATAYRNRGGSRLLGAIGSLDAGDASALARARTYARSDVVVLRTDVDALTALQHRLESQQRSAESARSTAETIAADLDGRLGDQQRAYDAAQDAAARAQAAAVRSIGSDATLIARMVDPGFGADDITATLAIAQAGQGEPPSLDGIFELPIRGAPLSSPFGLRIDPIGGAIGFHPGLDFGAESRTPIHAAAGGMVVVAGDCGGYGNCVVIDHGTSLATVYGHQSQVLVKVGDLVNPGQVIGLVGSTGISTGPHLHFEVRLHGAPIDPVPTLVG